MSTPSSPKPEHIGIALRKLTTPLAREVAELLLLKADLESVVEGFKLFGSVEENDDDPKQRRAALSIFRDTIVQLVACFDEENDYNLKAEEVFDKVQDGQQFVKWAKDLRDYWIAHRTGPARLAAYGFAIDPVTGDIVADGPFVMIQQPPDKMEVAHFIRFTTIALDHVDALLETKTSLLRKEAQSLHPSQRKGLPNARLVVAEGKQTRMGRRKFQNVADQQAQKSKSTRGDRSR